MTPGDLIKYTYKEYNIVEIYEVISINSGCVNEIEVVKLQSLCEENTIGGEFQEIAIPISLFESMLELDYINIFKKKKISKYKKLE